MVPLTLMAWPRREAWCINFLGMHPTLTQVPPSPHVLPAGEGGGVEVREKGKGALALFPGLPLALSTFYPTKIKFR